MNPKMDENDDDIMYWAENKLWRHNTLSSITYNSSHQKSDFGWEMFSDTLSPSTWQISTISSSTNPPNILYFGTQSKRLYGIDNAHIGDPPIVPLANFGSSWFILYEYSSKPIKC